MEEFHLLDNFYFAGHLHHPQQRPGVQGPYVNEPAHTTGDQKATISAADEHNMKQEGRQHLNMWCVFNETIDGRKG